MPTASSSPKATRRRSWTARTAQLGSPDYDPAKLTEQHFVEHTSELCRTECHPPPVTEQRKRERPGTLMRFFIAKQDGGTTKTMDGLIAFARTMMQWTSLDVGHRYANIVLFLNGVKVECVVRAVKVHARHQQPKSCVHLYTFPTPARQPRVVLLQSEFGFYQWAQELSAVTDADANNSFLLRVHKKSSEVLNEMRNDFVNGERLQAMAEQLHKEGETGFGMSPPLGTRWVLQQPVGSTNDKGRASRLGSGQHQKTACTGDDQARSGLYADAKRTLRSSVCKGNRRLQVTLLNPSLVNQHVAAPSTHCPCTKRNRRVSRYKRCWTSGGAARPCLSERCVGTWCSV